MHILSPDLAEKLKADSLHFCRCWLLTLTNGTKLGLTDHDRRLTFDGVDFEADTGMTPAAVEVGADLARDGSEVMGVLGSTHITQKDLNNGLYDGAEISLWLVDWQDTANRLMLMKGVFGQVRYENDAFHVTLEGPSCVLQQSVGRVYQKKCDALLGDGKCRMVLTDARYQVSTQIVNAQALEIEVPLLADFETGWFSNGEMEFLSNASVQGKFAIRSDTIRGGRRFLGLWESLTALPIKDDAVKLTAGCDKKLATCRDKFSNAANFQGMPHIPANHLLVKAVD